MPRVGAPARVVHFGGSVQDAVVVAVDDDGRRLLVRDAAGATVEFVLNRATARFVAAGGGHGPRLELLGERR
jgi:hypothetical protein